MFVLTVHWYAVVELENNKKSPIPLPSRIFVVVLCPNWHHVSLPMIGVCLLTQSALVRTIKRKKAHIPLRT